MGCTASAWSVTAVMFGPLTSAARWGRSTSPRCCSLRRSRRPSSLLASTHARTASKCRSKGGALMANQVRQHDRCRCDCYDVGAQPLQLRSRAAARADPGRRAGAGDHVRRGDLEAWPVIGAPLATATAAARPAALLRRSNTPHPPGPSLAGQGLRVQRLAVSNYSPVFLGGLVVVSSASRKSRKCRRKKATG